MRKPDMITSDNYVNALYLVTGKGYFYELNYNENRWIQREETKFIWKQLDLKSLDYAQK